MASWSNPMLGNVDGPGQKYGDPRSGGRVHVGYDIGTGGVTGRPVVAASYGTVIEVDHQTTTARGKYVMIDHGDNIRTLYQHLESITVNTGDTVTTGQTIGICGNTGSGGYPIHLHLEVHTGGTGTSKSPENTVDPKPFFLARGVALGITPPITDPNPPEDDMPLNDADKAWISATVHDKVVQVLRAEEFREARNTEIAAAVLNTSVDPNTGNVRTTLRDARVISRRHEAAWREHEGLPAN